MAVEVTLHENPFENLVVWEKQSPISTSKHRNRTCLKAIDTIVIKDDNAKDEYHTDYCVLAAAAKEPSSQHGRSRPVLLSDRNHPRPHYSTGSYNTFARTHISGPVYEERTLSPSNQRITTTSGAKYDSDINKYNDKDVQLFCCNRDVDCIIDYATCMCCVKGAIYHCTKDSYDEGNMAADPCNCEQDPSTRACVSRWACMALCSLFLPCVLCYLPARGCVQVCTCYKQQRTANAKRQRARIKDPH